jgi:hypothetical protein
MDLPQRHANGRLIPGQASLNPGGRPRNAAAEMRARYLHHLPSLMENLFELAHSPNEMVRLASIRLALDHLLGRPAVSVDTTVTKMDLSEAIGEAYRRSLIRTNSHAVPSEPVIDGNSNSTGASGKIE